MKVFGYIDDGLTTAYHLFNFIQDETLRKVVFIILVLIVLKLLVSWIRR